MRWTRNCPGCENLLIYKSSAAFSFAKKHNKSCRSCSKKNSIPWNKGRPWDTGTLIKISNALKGRQFSDELKSHWSKIKTGKKFTDEHKRNIAKGIRKYRGNTYFTNGPAYNKTACKLFDEINTVLGWYGTHAENGGEFNVKDLGYWVDFYEPNLNIVIEYDESHHFRSSVLIKDKQRQDEIEQHLGCKFYRIPEGSDWKLILREYLE